MPYQRNDHIEPPSGERLATLEMWCRGKDQKDDYRHEANIRRMDEILAQVTKTNGRVDKLEKWQDQIKGGFQVTQWLIAGLAAMLGFLGAKFFHLG